MRTEYRYEIKKSFWFRVIIVLASVLSFIVYHILVRTADDIKVTNGNEDTHQNETFASHIIEPQQSSCINVTTELNRHYGGERLSRIEIPHLHDLESKKLCLSYKQQLKFFTMKDKLLSWSSHTNTIMSEIKLEGKNLYHHFLEPLAGNKFFAYILNDEYAFRHIFKNGGTTVGKHAFQIHQSRDKIGDRKLVATVRDPIDHFLSGWAECGWRLGLHKTSSVNGSLTNSSYDVRVRYFLNQTLDCRRQMQTSDYLSFSYREKRFCGCTLHVLPQINFLLFNDHEIDPKIDIVGDLAELQDLLELIGFKFRYKMKNGRDSTSNEVKQKNFPKLRNELSSSTLQQLCKFLALDYFVFDYEPPSECHKQITSDFLFIMSFST